MMQYLRVWFSLIVSAACVCASTGVFAQGLSVLETTDLRLLYFDPSENYLVPHVASSFENSMERQRFIFDYETDEKITTLLTDFGDYGNASARATPRNMLMLDTAETVASRYNIDRDTQDEYALTSQIRTAAAQRQTGEPHDYRAARGSARGSSRPGSIHQYLR